MVSTFPSLAGNGSRAACPHTVACSSHTAACLRRARCAQPFQHIMQRGLARRGGLICEAAKRPNAKKAGPPKAKAAKAKVQEQQKAPAAAPQQTGTTTTQRSEQRHAKEEQQQEEQHDGVQQAEAEVEPVPAATQQVAEPGAPADSGDQRRQQQEQALSREEPELKAAELRRQLQQQQRDASAKPNLIEGVLQEVQLIEWPTISSALLNTVLVIAIVAGFSVLLFFVNTLLAETSQALYGLSSPKQ